MNNPLTKISTKIFELGQKKRVLEEEINKVQSIYEVEYKKIQDITLSATALQNSINELENIAEEAGEEGVKFFEKVITSIDDSINVFGKIGDMSNETLLALNRVNDLVNKRKEELLAFDIEYHKQEENIRKEEERLAVLKSDLDIYKNRLQSKYDEMGLGRLTL